VGNGIWVDGCLSKEELDKLQKLLREAIFKAKNGELPWSYKDEKITFDAFIKLGAVVVSYGWNFPPKELWVKEDRDCEEECSKCLPSGPAGEPGREVWCIKLGYNFPKCPYGVVTKPTRPRIAW